jgi:superfamily II DNA or RNA helicase
MWSLDQINLYKSLFRGRDDVFAIRFEKGGKSGYMPACTFDPYHFKLHRMKGGDFQNYPDKKYLPYDNTQIIKHLNGEHLAGIYPLIKDDKSWFIAADFDKESWVEDCRKYLRACHEKNIPAYLERSRSGNGGHVWIFFEAEYPAVKSRRIVMRLLQSSGAVSVFDKDSSFDRLFPNQDHLSKKGFGNLIALPLHKHALACGNSCFIDPITLTPEPDQWVFLKSIKRISVDVLNSLHLEANSPTLEEAKPITGKLHISLDKSISLNRNAIPKELIEFLKDELNFANSEFVIKNKIGKGTWGTPRYFRLVEEIADRVVIPRGFIGRLLRYCKDNNILFEFNDVRKQTPFIEFASSIQLRKYQQVALEAASKKDFGVIVAPPGSGKTVVGLALIASKRRPALIIVHRKQLADQWMDRIETFLQIPRKEIGRIVSGNLRTDKQITVVLIQSLKKTINDPNQNEALQSFGTILVDECHHVPADTFRSTVERLSTIYLYGLTATPFRKYNDGKIIFTHLGEVIAEIKPNEIEAHLKTRVVIRDTELTVPFNIQTDKFETLSRILVHDSTRNKLIFNDLTRELNAGRRIVVLTERKDHIDTLNQYLKQFYETIVLSGDDTQLSRNAKWKMLHEGKYQVLVTTGQYFGEGSDLSNASCVFLVYPFSFEGKLIQYIGRVQRSTSDPVIYDYRDGKIDYLEKLFQKRNAYYKKFISEGPLFDYYEPSNSEKSFTIEEQIRIPVESLEFRFGNVEFKHVLEKLGKELSFEIANTNIRPEFEVLKPYFAKVLKSNKIKATIKVKVENGKLIYNFATSLDIQKIDREVVESVRFRFVTQSILKKFPDASNSNLLDIQQVQSELGDAKALYQSGEELLDEFLKYKDVKHYYQLRYLSQKHEGGILKIRFVLQPFSFVFLLTGQQQYHVIWETLNTEEATYIWHIEKNKSVLRNALQDIDGQLGIIRNRGRQMFLENFPSNFSRILHDYTDAQKGFILWKDMLEERLV